MMLRDKRYEEEKERGMVLAAVLVSSWSLKIARGMVFQQYDLFVLGLWKIA